MWLKMEINGSREWIWWVLGGDVGVSGKLMMEYDGSVGNMGVWGEWWDWNWDG